MQIVHVDHAVDGGEIDGEGIEVDTVGRRLQEDAYRPPAQACSAGQDPEPDPGTA